MSNDDPDPEDWASINPAYWRYADKSAVEDVCDLPGGHKLHRQPNGAGGWAYFSDQIGGGVVVWDTSLVDQTTLLIAMAEEGKRADAEARAAEVKPDTYHDPSFPERKCRFCDRKFTGREFYCSFLCMINRTPR